MQRSLPLCSIALALTALAVAPRLTAQTPGGPPPGITIQPPPASPLGVGIAAEQHGDYAAAKTFFLNYLATNPTDLDAQLFLGGAYQGLKDFPAAIREFQAVIAAAPNKWPAHNDLLLAYAQAQDWPNFDREFAALKSFRDHNAPGLDKTGSNLIDLLQVGNKTYRVLYFYVPTGRFHTRYVFAHYGDSLTPTDYIACESDDIDQVSFKQAHPDLAAAGQRSYSLDSYVNGPNGQTQGLIKFYSDGEPTYETVRADALKVLQGQSHPLATHSPN